MRPLSGCIGFTKTFDSPGITADGTTRTASTIELTHVDPRSFKLSGPGIWLQSEGRSLGVRIFFDTSLGISMATEE